jgi:hypothetical protein
MNLSSSFFASAAGIFSILNVIYAMQSAEKMAPRLAYLDDVSTASHGTLLHLRQNLIHSSGTKWKDIYLAIGKNIFVSCTRKFYSTTEDYRKAVRSLIAECSTDFHYSDEIICEDKNRVISDCKEENIEEITFPSKRYAASSHEFQYFRPADLAYENRIVFSNPYVNLASPIFDNSYDPTINKTWPIFANGRTANFVSFDSNQVRVHSYTFHESVTHQVSVHKLLLGFIPLFIVPMSTSGILIVAFDSQHDKDFPLYSALIESRDLSSVDTSINLVPVMIDGEHVLITKADVFMDCMLVLKASYYPMIRLNNLDIVFLTSHGVFNDDYAKLPSTKLEMFVFQQKRMFPETLTDNQLYAVDKTIKARAPPEELKTDGLVRTSSKLCRPALYVGTDMPPEVMNPHEKCGLPSLKKENSFNQSDFPLIKKISSRSRQNTQRDDSGDQLPAPRLLFGAARDSLPGDDLSLTRNKSSMNDSATRSRAGSIVMSRSRSKRLNPDLYMSSSMNSSTGSGIIRKDSGSLDFGKDLKVFLDAHKELKTQHIDALLRLIDNMVKNASKDPRVPSFDVGMLLEEEDPSLGFKQIGLSLKLFGSSSRFAESLREYWHSKVAKDPNISLDAKALFVYQLWVSGTLIENHKADVDFYGDFLKYFDFLNYTSAEEWFAKSMERKTLTPESIQEISPWFTGTGASVKGRVLKDFMQPLLMLALDKGEGAPIHRPEMCASNRKFQESQEFPINISSTVASPSDKWNFDFHLVKSFAAEALKNTLVKMNLKGIKVKITYYSLDGSLYSESEAVDINGVRNTMLQGFADNVSKLINYSTTLKDEDWKQFLKAFKDLKEFDKMGNEIIREGRFDEDQLLHTIGNMIALLNLSKVYLVSPLPRALLKMMFNLSHTIDFVDYVELFPSSIEFMENIQYSTDTMAERGRALIVDGKDSMEGDLNSDMLMFEPTTLRDVGESLLMPYTPMTLPMVMREFIVTKYKPAMNRLDKIVEGYRSFEFGGFFKPIEDYVHKHPQHIRSFMMPLGISEDQIIPRIEFAKSGHPQSNEENERGMFNLLIRVVSEYCRKGEYVKVGDFFQAVTGFRFLPANKNIAIEFKFRPDSKANDPLLFQFHTCSSSMEFFYNDILKSKEHFQAKFETSIGEAALVLAG